MKGEISRVLARQKTAMLAVVVAVVFVAAPTALAANGKPWLLGKNNSATKTTALGGTAGVNGPTVRLINNNANPDATALELRVEPGLAPMIVDSSTQVENLNADLVDGRSASSFVANSTYRLGQGQERAGDALSDGSKVLSQSCQSGDRLLSGGPASVNAASDVLDSFAQDTNTWQARINDSAVSGGDSFTVVVLCADQ
jgi:hypothetical protein